MDIRLGICVCHVIEALVRTGRGGTYHVISIHDFVCTACCRSCLGLHRVTPSSGHSSRSSRTCWDAFASGCGKAGASARTGCLEARVRATPPNRPPTPGHVSTGSSTVVSLLYSSSLELLGRLSRDPMQTMVTLYGAFQCRGFSNASRFLCAMLLLRTLARSSSCTSSPQ